MHSVVDASFVVTVEILYFEGCPSFETLLPRVREILAETGRDIESITVHAVETPEAAAAFRFLGSPTVRVDGRDVDPSAAQRDDFGLKCRIYRSAEGQAQISPEDWIRAAIAAAGSDRR